MRNTDLYYASYYLYKAATFLPDLDSKSRTRLLDMATGYLNKAGITNRDLYEEIEEYYKIIEESE